MRRRRNGLRVLMWGCVLAGMPLLAAGMLQLIPQIPVAANRLNDLRTDLEQEPADNRRIRPVCPAAMAGLQRSRTPRNRNRPRKSPLSRRRSRCFTPVGIRGKSPIPLCGIRVAHGSSGWRISAIPAEILWIWTSADRFGTVPVWTMPHCWRKAGKRQLLPLWGMARRRC